MAFTTGIAVFHAAKKSGMPLASRIFTLFRVSVCYFPPRIMPKNGVSVSASLSDFEATSRLME